MADQILVTEEIGGGKWLVSYDDSERTVMSLYRFPSGKRCAKGVKDIDLEAARQLIPDFRVSVLRTIIDTLLLGLGISERFIGDLGLGVIYHAWLKAGDDSRAELLQEAVVAISPIRRLKRA